MACNMARLRSTVRVMGAGRSDRDDSQLRRLMADRLRNADRQIAEAEDEKARVTARLEKLRTHRDHLALVLAEIGGSETTLEPASTRQSEPGRAPPGNRSGSMPPRRPEFASVTLQEAVAKLITAQSEVQADDLARQIFIIATRDQLHRSKMVLASTLSRGVRAELWKKAARGRFKANGIDMLVGGVPIEVKVR